MSIQNPDIFQSVIEGYSGGYLFVGHEKRGHQVISKYGHGLVMAFTMNTGNQVYLVEEVNQNDLRVGPLVLEESKYRSSMLCPGNSGSPVVPLAIDLEKLRSGDHHFDDCVQGVYVINGLPIVLGQVEAAYPNQMVDDPYGLGQCMAAGIINRV